MQILARVRPHGLRPCIRLRVAASLLQVTEREDPVDLRVPRIHLAVTYVDGQPVVGLGSENVSVVNAQNPADLTYLFCVTAFSALPTDGTYEVAVDGAKWSHEESESRCCLVQFTRVARLSHAIETGSTKCCVPPPQQAQPMDVH